MALVATAVQSSDTSKVLQYYIGRLIVDNVELVLQLTNVRSTSTPL